jgi:hypothetical protein
MTMTDDFVTGAEFGRFRLDFSAYQGREAKLLEAMEGRIVAHIDTRCDGLDERLDVLNGQTRKNTDSVVLHNEKIETIQRGGCGQLAAHRTLLEGQRGDSDGGTSRTLFRDKRTYAGGGLALAGTAALYGIARLLEALAAATAQHVTTIAPIMK